MSREDMAMRMRMMLRWTGWLMSALTLSALGFWLVRMALSTRAHRMHSATPMAGIELSGGESSVNAKTLDQSLTSD